MKNPQLSDLSVTCSQNKIFQLDELDIIFQKNQKKGKTIGVIGGCFDVLHMGHIDLFRYAKARVDLLCVILDNDKTIRASKGKKHPLFTQDIRADQLAELASVDLVAIWDKVMRSGSKNTNQLWHDFLSRSRPNYHITNVDADVYWERKKQLCDKLAISFLGYSRTRISSSTELMDKMIEHFTHSDF